MPSVNDLLIDLKLASESPEAQSFVLSDDFFRSLEQDEIIGGHVSVSLRVKSVGPDVYKLDFSIKGDVLVACDRCLEDLTLGIDVEDSVKVTQGRADEAITDPDVKLMAKDSSCYDVAWDIYEAIVLSLPMQRVHAEGECNGEMLGYLCVSGPEE